MFRLVLAPVLIFFSVTSAVGCASTTDSLGLPELVTVEGLDIERYDGVWYEIANFPMSVQEGCSSTTATYSLNGFSMPPAPWS